MCWRLLTLMKLAIAVGSGSGCCCCCGCTWPHSYMAEQICRTEQIKNSKSNSPRGSKEKYKIRNARAAVRRVLFYFCFCRPTCFWPSSSAKSANESIGVSAYSAMKTSLDCIFGLAAAASRDASGQPQKHLSKSRLPARFSVCGRYTVCVAQIAFSSSARHFN